MDQLKIMIVEDELIIAEDLKSQLTKIGYKVTGIATSYAEAVKLINSEEPDLAIVDIIIKGTKTGIDLGQYLRNETNIPFIYLSSHSDKTTVGKAKETNPDAYLLKPFRTEGLFASIEIAISNSSKKTRTDEKELNIDNIDNLLAKDSLFIKKGHLFFKVRINDILFLKSEGNYLEIYTNNNNKHLIRSTISSFLELLAPFGFFQCHKSYLINLEYIDVVSYTFVKIKEHEIPLSKSKKDELLSAMKSFS